MIGALARQSNIEDGASGFHANMFPIRMSHTLDGAGWRPPAGLARFLHRKMVMTISHCDRCELAASGVNVVFLCLKSHSSLKKGHPCSYRDRYWRKMTTRKASFDRVDINEEEDDRPVKRPRLSHGAFDYSPSLGSLNDDCLLQILSYLPADDLNSIAMCNRRYRVARANEDLDQTRTGTIFIPAGSSVDSFLNAIHDKGWNQVFEGNRTCLRIVGMENLNEWRSNSQGNEDHLHGVTSLFLSGQIPIHPYNIVQMEKNYITVLSNFFESAGTEHGRCDIQGRIFASFHQPIVQKLSQYVETFMEGKKSNGCIR